MYAQRISRQTKYETAVKLEQTYTIDPTTADQIACDFLADATDISKQKIKDAMTKGAVWLKRHNKSRKRLRRAKEVLQNRDKLELFYDETLLARKAQGAICLLDANGYSVWFKPAGVVAQGNDWCDHLSIQRIAEQTLEPKRTAFVVHRLDRDTSGLILLARGRESLRRCSALFAERRVSKLYEAEVRGRLRGRGRIENRLARLQRNPPRYGSHPEGRRAVTLWRTRSLRHGSTRLWLRPITGRSHQLRAHLAELGHPILGDPIYAENPVGPLRLHACALALTHPFTGERLRVCSPEGSSSPARQLLWCEVDDCLNASQPRAQGRAGMG